MKVKESLLLVHKQSVMDKWKEATKKGQAISNIVKLSQRQHLRIVIKPALQ